MSSATLLGGRPEATFKETLRSIRIMESNPLCKKNALETRLQRKMSSLPHAPWFLLGSLCLGTSCLYFVMALLLSHSEDGRGQWEREGSSVLQKNYSRRKGNFLVYDPTFYHLCFSESWIRMFFRSPAFFSESGGKCCRIEAGTFFRPKEDPGICLHWGGL